MKRLLAVIFALILALSPAALAENDGALFMISKNM